MRLSVFAKAIALLSVVFPLQIQDSVDVYRAEASRLVSELYRSGTKPAARFSGAFVPRNEFFKRPRMRLPLLVVHEGDPPSKRRARAFLLALAGEWNEAERVFRELALEFPADAAIQNDLGVAQLGNAPSDPMSWVRALEQFQRASAAMPEFQEPRFNTILVYQRLGLTQLEAEARRNYRQIELRLEWESVQEQLNYAHGIDPASLNTRIEAMQDEELTTFVRNNPGEARTVVMQYALRPTNPVPKNYLRIGEELSRLGEDETVKLALAPLLTENLSAISAGRSLVETGRKLYFEDRLKESHDAYEKARSHIGTIASVFDRVWIDANDTDTLIRAGDLTRARPLLNSVLSITEAQHLRWMRARALSAFGPLPILAGSVYQTILRLREALDIYREIGDRQESSRALNYLATYLAMAGNWNEALRFAIDALSAANESDHVRRSQLHTLVADLLSQMGHLQLATAFAEQAIYDAERTDNPGSVANTRMHLAEIKLSRNLTDEAANDIELAYKVIPQIAAEPSKTSREVETNLVQAKLLLKRNRFFAAETTLRRNIRLILAHPRYFPIHMYSQSRLLLAEALDGQGNYAKAEQEFYRAVESVENEQRYLSLLELQIAFDRERRHLYESAVRFEYRYRGCEQAWNLLQRYKAKLFLDLLGKFTPSVQRLNLFRLTMADVWMRLPANVQILEYAVLRDQLLTWVLSDHSMKCRSIPLQAGDLESQIGSLVNQVRMRNPSEELSYRLYETLIEPVSDLLDDNRTMIIIPDAALHRVPFAALKSRKSGHYLIEKAPILESPSVSYLFTGGEFNTSGIYTAFGSRTYDTFTHKELTAVRMIEPSVTVHNGSEVTKGTFLKALLGSSLLYYAGHSALDLREPLQAAILLDGDRSGPNTVSALEIIEQRMLSNSAIILSSCETSIGTSTDGPSMRGLTSAFLVAGAGSVVGSLWAVESESTTQLMPLVLRSLVKENQSIVQSLRQAQLTMLRNPQFSHPYFWSSFVVTGNLSAAGAPFRR